MFIVMDSSVITVDGTSYTVSDTEDVEDLKSIIEFEAVSVQSYCQECGSSFEMEFSHSIPKRIEEVCSECDAEQVVTDYRYKYPLHTFARHLAAFDLKRIAQQKSDTVDVSKEVRLHDISTKIYTTGLLTALAALGVLIYATDLTEFSVGLFALACIGLLGGRIGMYYSKTNIKTELQLPELTTEVIDVLASNQNE